jgi:hypothetical protein
METDLPIPVTFAQFSALAAGVGLLLHHLSRDGGKRGCDADSNASHLLTDLLSRWPTTPAVRNVVPARLPVLRCLPMLGHHTAAVTASLVRQVVAVAGECRWRQTYQAAEAPAAFLDNYAWTELVGLNGPLASRELACGFLLLGPATDYPSHHHLPEELYVPLSGTAVWQQGGQDPARRPPASVIHHRPGEPHAMQTESQPLLALYVWRGTDLNQQAKWLSGAAAQQSNTEP